MDPATRIEYDLGCDYNDTTHFGGIWAAGNAKLTIAIMGLSPVLEGEAGDAFLSKSGGDKTNISLPASEIAYLKQLRASVKTPIIVVITAGSNVDVSSIEQYADAIIYAWYPGEQGGNALADILLGTVSPSGRLPITFYKSTTSLPDYTSYAMKGRTYRYYDGPIQYPFGYGLSYSRFSYKNVSNQQALNPTKDEVVIHAEIANTGNMDAAEIIQAYVQYPDAERMPVKELKYFKRVEVKKGAAEKVKMVIPVKDLKKWDLKKNQWVLYPGKYKVNVGASSTDIQFVAEFVID
jgi:beta-glucosidase